MNIPQAALIPFLVTALAVALWPSLQPHFWRKNKIHIVLIPVFAASLLSLHFHGSWIISGFLDYVNFITLMASLYCIGGGLYLSGLRRATPFTNVLFLALGGIVANLIGTLGASILFIRPLLRANSGRRHLSHLVVFYIFIVGNVGGLLSPLGDPPLLMGYYWGVPFWWPFKLMPHWLFVAGFLLMVFALVDMYLIKNDAPVGQVDSEESWHLAGRANLLLLLPVMAALVLPQFIPHPYEIWRTLSRLAVCMIVVAINRRITPPLVWALNRFSWKPFQEVALIFFGLFMTLPPVYYYLQAHAADLNIHQPATLYWVSGFVSAFLDNAPTYLSFLSVGTSMQGVPPYMILAHGQQISESILTALSAGTVLFGGLTYIGNAPNLLIREIAEESGVRTPSFIGYMVWSFAYLMPILWLTALAFF